MKTSVLISVDIEFSIAGAFNDPENNKPVGLQSVFCEKNGKSHGLGFILDTLNKYEISATFFVEALNSNYFGHDLMGEIAHTIKKRGQDIQLHLHPCWQYFKDDNWREQVKKNKPNDDICQRSYQDIESLLLEGIDIFSKWGLSRPAAIRTGSLCVKKDIYKAMHNVGIGYSSNIGVGIYRPSEPELKLYSGCHEIEACFELPVLTYSGINLFSKQHLKLLTITGSSLDEIKFLLNAAAENQFDYVVILTHPSEFVKKQNNQYTDFHPNQINKKRFDRLCEFLQYNKEKFLVSTFSDLQTGARSSNANNTLLEMPHKFTLKRIVENYANDKIAKI